MVKLTPNLDCIFQQFLLDLIKTVLFLLYWFLNERQNTSSYDCWGKEQTQARQDIDIQLTPIKNCKPQNQVQSSNIIISIVLIMKYFENKILNKYPKSYAYNILSKTIIFEKLLQFQIYLQ